MMNGSWNMSLLISRYWQASWYTSVNTLACFSREMRTFLTLREEENGLLKTYNGKTAFPSPYIWSTFQLCKTDLLSGFCAGVKFKFVGFPWCEQSHVTHNLTGAGVKLMWSVEHMTPILDVVHNLFNCGYTVHWWNISPSKVQNEF